MIAMYRPPSAAHRVFNISGFSLAELLIALAILGVIATFSVPKILQAQQSSKNNALAKEVAATLAGAVQAYRAERGSFASTYATSLTPYLNYVRVDTVSTIDFRNDGSTRDCFAATKLCVVLHHGGILQVDTGDSAPNPPSALSAYPFVYDPNGQVDGINQPGTAIQFWVYTTGKVRTRGTIDVNTCVNATCTYAPEPNWDPPWFSW